MKDGLFQQKNKMPKISMPAGEAELESLAVNVNRYVLTSQQFTFFELFLEIHKQWMV